MSDSTLFRDYEFMLVSAVVGALGYLYLGQIEASWSLACGFCAGIGLYFALIPQPKFEKIEITEIEKKIAA